MEALCNFAYFFVYLKQILLKKKKFAKHKLNQMANCLPLVAKCFLRR